MPLLGWVSGVSLAGAFLRLLSRWSLPAHKTTESVASGRARISGSAMTQLRPSSSALPSAQDRPELPLRHSSVVVESRAGLQSRATCGCEFRGGSRLFPCARTPQNSTTQHLTRCRTRTDVPCACALVIHVVTLVWREGTTCPSADAHGLGL